MPFFSVVFEICDNSCLSPFLYWGPRMLQFWFCLSLLTLTELSVQRSSLHCRCVGSLVTLYRCTARTLFLVLSYCFSKDLASSQWPRMSIRAVTLASLFVYHDTCGFWHACPVSICFMVCIFHTTVGPVLIYSRFVSVFWYPLHWPSVYCETEGNLGFVILLYDFSVLDQHTRHQHTRHRQGWRLNPVRVIWQQLQQSFAHPLLLE